MDSPARFFPPYKFYLSTLIGPRRNQPVTRKPKPSSRENGPLRAGLFINRRDASLCVEPVYAVVPNNTKGTRSRTKKQAKQRTRERTAEVEKQSLTYQRLEGPAEETKNNQVEKNRRHPPKQAMQETAHQPHPPQQAEKVRCDLEHGPLLDESKISLTHQKKHGVSPAVASIALSTPDSIYQNTGRMRHA